MGIEMRKYLQVVEVARELIDKGNISWMDAINEAKRVAEHVGYVNDNKKETH